jgi:hypothetical protein
MEACSRISLIDKQHLIVLLQAGSFFSVYDFSVNGLIFFLKVSYKNSSTDFHAAIIWNKFAENNVI